jgi:flagellar basal body-associated protein FliL
MEELAEIETKDDKQKRKIPVILFVLFILLLIAGCVYALLAPAISNVFENILEEGALVGNDYLGALRIFGS